MLQVEVIDTTELGDRSYVAHDGSVAIVIDPQRDIDRVEALLAERALNCVAVLETHMHNDYVTGGLELATRSQASYVVNDADPVAFDRQGVFDEEKLSFGDLRVTVLATPGHTVTHVAFFVEDAIDGGAPAVFTGGSVVFGSVGRTDLVDADRTEELTRAQFHSARRLGDLPGETHVFPTHGFGSFCSSGSASGGDESTIAAERERNDALVEDDEDTFVERLIAKLTAYPAYYAHMGARNLEGPGPIDLSLPQLVDAEQLRKRLASDEWVVDLRGRVAYSTEHVTGSIGIELGAQFATYLGWLIPWGTPLTLLGETADQVAAAQRQLVRIGIDRPDAAAIGTPAVIVDDPATELGSYARVTFDDLAAAQQRSGFTVLDVRRDDEWATAAVPDSVHVPLHSLLKRMEEVPEGPLWVHCASGFRASVAVSILNRVGHDATLIDDDFTHAVELDLT